MLKYELKSLIQLAWPLLIAQLTQTLMGVSDTIMAGRYSAEDMAAVAIGFSITMPVLFFIQGVIMALPPIVSRLHGAGKESEVARYTQQALYLALTLALVVASLSVVVPAIFDAIQLEPGVRQITVGYIQYILYSAPFFALYQVLRHCCEGLSITKPSMVIMVIGLLVNIPANYVFIYGELGMPAYGGIGCGIATMLVFVAMSIATLLYTAYAKKLAGIRLYASFYRPRIDIISEIFRLGFPIALTILFEVTLFGVVALLLARFGTTVVAAHQVALNFSSIMFMFPLTIGMATTIRVGRTLGQGQQGNSRVVVQAALGLALFIAVFTASLTVLLRTQISALYTADVSVIELASNLMFLAALFQFSDAIQVVSAGALRGYKDTRAMLYLTFFSYWMVGLPIGCILALTDWWFSDLGASGFWIGFICGLTCAAILLGLRLKLRQRHMIAEAI